MKKSLLLGAAATFTMAIPAVAHAGGPPVAGTDTASVAESVPFDGPCTGPGIVTIDYHVTVHETRFEDGRGVFKFNQAGTFEFQPADGPISTGHYRNGFTTVATANTFGDTSNFIVRGTNEDGERVAFKIHTAFVVSNGEVRVEVVDIECG